MFHLALNSVYEGRALKQCPNHPGRKVTQCCLCNVNYCK